MPTSKTFLSAAQIAKRLHVCKRTVHRTAQQQGWPVQRQGNRFLFAPPSGLAGQLRAAPETIPAIFPPAVPGQDHSRWWRVWRRFEAIAALHALVASGVGIENALRRVSAAHSFSVSPSSLRGWALDYSRDGFPGLYEKKCGRVGRKARAHRRAK